MINLADYPAISGSYPSVVTVNNTAPTSNDGTPLTKSLFDDIFGLFQALTYQGGITPSGSNDTYDDCDLLKGMQNILGGPGELVMYLGELSTLYASEKRLLQCVGQTVLISSYQDLVDTTYKGDAFNSAVNHFYKCSDSGGTVRDTAGPYFKLPDFRGVFIRGYDNGRALDPDYSSRGYMGEIQYDAIKAHDHEIKAPGIGSSYEGYISDADPSGSTYHMIKLLTSGSSQVFASDFDDQNEDESRPVNLNVIICLRY